MYEVRRFKTGDSFYGAWFPREGDNAIFRAEAVAEDTNAELTIDVYTKNSDDAGTPTANMPVATVTVDCAYVEAHLRTALRHMRALRPADLSTAKFIRFLSDLESGSVKSAKTGRFLKPASARTNAIRLPVVPWHPTSDSA